MKNGLIIDGNGDKIWYQDDEYHRLDGPACEYANGTKSWYVNNKLHRVDGPAIEWSNGDKSWWQDGYLHRIDGPAMQYGRENQWFYKGREIYVSSQKEYERILNLKVFW
jgi:hypothetical protein